MGFLDGSAGKESACNAGDTGHVGLIPGLGGSPGGGKWQFSPVFLSEKSHGQRCLMGYSPWGRKELAMTYRLNNSNNSSEAETDKKTENSDRAGAGPATSFLAPFAK